MAHGYLEESPSNSLRGCKVGCTWERLLKTGPPSSRIFFHLPLPYWRTRLISEVVSLGLQRPFRRRLPPPVRFLGVLLPMLPSPVRGSPFGPTSAIPEAWHAV